MAKLSRELAVGTINPREDIFKTITLGSLNAEGVIESDGCATVAIDLRGTFNLTAEIAGSIDGTNWVAIPMRPINVASVQYVAAITGAVQGVWYGDCSIYRKVRVRATAWTSGAATATLTCSNACPNDMIVGMVSTNTATSVGAAGAAVTLALAAPGAGLRHYITYLSINRFASAVLTAAAAPVSITTTNLPTALAFSFEAEAAAQGTISRWREDFAYPIAVSAQNTATTIVCPITTGVIWRVTAGFYVAP